MRPHDNRTMTTKASKPAKGPVRRVSRCPALGGKHFWSTPDGSGIQECAFCSETKRCRREHAAKRGVGKGK